MGSLYIAKYNTSDGAVRWTKLAATCDTTDIHSDLGERVLWKDSLSHCNSRAIGVDPNGDVIITGKFFGTLNFDNNVRLVSGTNCRTRAGTGRVCEHSVYVAKFQRQNGDFVWADKITDPVHIKANPGTLEVDGQTIIVKQEFNAIANRVVVLWQRLDDAETDISSGRVADNWPMDTDGLNANLYTMWDN